MRRLTVQEVMEQHGGKLPPDAVLRGDDEPEAPPSPPPASMAKPKRRGRSERFNALNALVDVTMSELTGAELKVWLVLFRDTKQNGLAQTGQTDIARRAGLSIRGVQKAIGKLRAKGIIDVMYLGRLNNGPSRYRVHPLAA